MRTLATLIAGAALAMVAVMGPSASAGTTSPAVPHPAKCAAVDHSLIHQMAPTGMAWQVIRPATARTFHVSPCSIILDGALVNGQRSSMIITPSLRIVARS